MSDENFIVTRDLYASKGKRFLNYIIDYAVFYAAFAGTFFVFVVIVSLTSNDTLWLDELIFEMENMSPLLDRLITACIFVLFYMLSETLLKGRTVGKYVTKTKVVMEDGVRPKASDIILRSLCRLIPFNAFSFLGEQGRGWHDSISNTYVVDIAKFENKKTTKLNLEQLGQKQED